MPRKTLLSDADDEDRALKFNTVMDSNNKLTEQGGSIPNSSTFLAPPQIGVNGGRNRPRLSVQIPKAIDQRVRELVPANTNKLVNRVTASSTNQRWKKTTDKVESSYLPTSALLPKQLYGTYQVYEIFEPGGGGFASEESFDMTDLNKSNEQKTQEDEDIFKKESETSPEPRNANELSKRGSINKGSDNFLSNEKTILSTIFRPNLFRLWILKLLLLPQFEFLINVLVFWDWLILVSLCFELSLDGEIVSNFLGDEVIWPQHLRYFLHSLFLIELLFKAYAYGLVFSPYRVVPGFSTGTKTSPGPGFSYHHVSYNGTSGHPPDILFNIVGSVDLISVLAFWANAVLSLPVLEQCGWGEYPLIVALSCLRPWRLLTLFPKFSSITNSIFKALPLLGNLAFFYAYFSLLFATLGLVLFKGHGRSQCSIDGQVVWPEYYCRGHYADAKHTEVDYLAIGGGDQGKPFFSGYICTYPSKCVTQAESSFENFNTIYTSMLTVYVISSVESWAQIMYRTMSMASPWTSMFFVSCVMILNYCLVALFVAVIASIFEKIREEKEAARRLESKAYAPAPTVEAGFEFELLQPPRKSDIPDVCNNVKFKWRLLFEKVENAILKTLPLLSFVALFLIGVDLLVRSYYVGNLILHPHIYLTIHSLLLLESTLQLLRLRRPTLLRIDNPNIPHDIGIRWMCIGICLHFILCLFSLASSLYWVNDRNFPLRTQFLLSIFPILRFYRLPLSIPRIQALFWLLAARVSSIVSLMGFTLTSILLIVPISMQLICLNLNAHQEDPDALAYFDSLRNSMLSLFQIFTGEDWPDVMAVVANHSNTKSQAFVIIFFVAWSGFSNLILLNLFIAQTMECFELPESRKHHSQIKHYVDSATKASVYQQKNPIGTFNPYRYLNPAPSFINPFDLPKSLLLHIPYYLADNFLRFVDEDSKVAQNMTERDYLSAEFRHSHPMYDTSWFLFRPGHHLRRFCQQLTESSFRGYSLVFNLVVWAAVLAAVGMALVNTPQFRYNELTKSQEEYLLLINLVLAAFFLFEFAVRTIAHGFLLTPNAYLKHPWYVVEFTVLIVFLVDVGLSLSPKSHIIQIVCSLKALRALRLMSLVPKVKDTIYGIFIVGFPRILDVSLLLLSLIVPCAFYGHLLFSRHGSTCSDESVTYSASCFGEFVHPESYILMPRVWNNFDKFSFETIGSSMLVLIEILSGEKWVKVVESVMYFDSEDFLGSSTAWWYCLYFVFYYIVGSIIVMSMFVAVIIENYRRYTGAACLTSSQRHWIDLRKQLLQATPSLRPTHSTISLQQWCRHWTTAKDGVWPNILSVAHTLLLLCLVTEFNGQGCNVSRIKGCVRVLLLLISLVDHVIRILGLGLKTLRHSLWNSAHALVTGIALVATLLSIYSENNLFVYDLSNILSLAVTLKLMFRFNRLSELAKMASASLPSILMTLYAWFVLLITYSILFMQIFGLTRHGEEGSNVESFRTFGFTFLMLFRMTTGENWNDFMHDYAVQAPFCVASPDYLNSDCGSPILAYFLFLSFNVLSMFIFTNLFVIIVIDSFNYCRDAAASFSLLTRSDLRHLKHTWSLFDHHARGFIPSSSLVPFILSLNSPFDLRYIDSSFSIKALRESYTMLDSVDDSDYLAYAQWLNDKLAFVPHHLAQRRRRFNIFYHHAMTLEEAGKGISFTNTILLLSQYKLINPTQCMSILDLLQFKKAQKQVYHLYFTEKALGICRTWILRRNFLKRFATPIPPTIFVNLPPNTELQADSSDGWADAPTGSSNPLPSPTTSSSSSWFVPTITTITLPWSESLDTEDGNPQDLLASLNQSPWAICLSGEVQSHGCDDPSPE